jgi:SAM-dependent methyltransferase
MLSYGKSWQHHSCLINRPLSKRRTAAIRERQVLFAEGFHPSSYHFSRAYSWLHLTSSIRGLAKRVEREGVSNIRPLHAGAGEGKLDWNVFDRAIMVTVLGEIPDKLAALVEVYEALKPGGLLSITEVFPDPDYQSLATVRRLAHQAGFVEAARFGTALVFTINFKKPLSTPLTGRKGIYLRVRKAPRKILA